MGKSSKRTNPNKPDDKRKKEARGTEAVNKSSGPKRFCCHLGSIDWEGPFGWGKLSKEKLKNILQKAKSYETMTWFEVWKVTRGQNNKTENHTIQIDICTKKARARFRKIFPEETGREEVFSLSIQGQERVIGVMEEGYIFQIIWWDPEHQFCKSEK